MNTINDKALFNTYGIVVCGGNSSRMGTDKSMLQYFEKPQRYHVYDMLTPLCEKVFISCNKQQGATIENGYQCIEDNAAFSNIGPMAALLSAWALYPDKNILLIGCDYPFLTASELEQFLLVCNNKAVAFYNGEAGVYEPLLSWYPSAAYNEIKNMHKAGQFSLQHFLQHTKAAKYYPAHKDLMISIDTPEAFHKVIGRGNI